MTTQTRQPTRTPTTIEVNLMDVSGLETQAFEAIDKIKYPKATYCRVGSAPHGFIETKKGIYALSHEGCGGANPITRSNQYEIDCYAGWEHGGYMVSAMVISLTDIDLRRLATGKKVNLADFIRRFGARLEANYDSWRKHLEGRNK